VDKYLQSVEPGKFYLINHKKRAIFVKFTEQRLHINHKLYEKGKKTSVPADIDESVRKYYPKRYTLFEQFDSGIQMDTVGWFSVTPECVARYTAQRLPFDHIADFFSGVGGNSIQVADCLKSSR